MPDRESRMSELIFVPFRRRLEIGVNRLSSQSLHAVACFDAIRSDVLLRDATSPHFAWEQTPQHVIRARWGERVLYFSGPRQI
jgi:hypothetical protein